MLQSRERSDVPLATNALQQTASLFDHLVGSREHRGRHGKAERLGSLEIDHKVKLGGLLDRQVGGLTTLQDFMHVEGAAPPQVGLLSLIHI